MKPTDIPPVFHAAAIAELMELGYYRKDPVIEIHVNTSKVAFISRSEIIPIDDDDTARVDVPYTTDVPKGLTLIGEEYRLNGNLVEKGEKTVDVKGATKDRYLVEYERTGDTIQIVDSHRWRSPVTPFKVAFKYGDNLQCGPTKLLMKKMKNDGLKLITEPGDHKKTENKLEEKYKSEYEKEYEYGMASFSGQGFAWFVAWLGASATTAEIYDGPYQRRLRDTLINRFTHEDLKILLHDTLSKELDTISDMGNRISDTHRLLQWLGENRAKRLKPFFKAAIKEREDAPELQALYAELFG